MRHVTHDMWHMICDTWHVTPGGRWTFSKHFRSPAYTVSEWRCLEDLEEKDELPNRLMSDEGVCRTAPATLGLLIIRYRKNYLNLMNNTKRALSGSSMAWKSIVFVWGKYARDRQTYILVEHGYSWLILNDICWYRLFWPGSCQMMSWTYQMVSRMLRMVTGKFQMMAGKCQMVS